MGDVYRGRDLHTGQAVAIKALRPEVVSSDPNALARFLREGEALRQLDHPNIVKMIAAVSPAVPGDTAKGNAEGVAAASTEAAHYLVMEYLPGGSLRDLLDKQGRLSVERTVEIALDVADALTRAHRLGILHRDLKPSNVLLAEDGMPRLSDFGIAHMSGGRPLTQTGGVVGTVDYLSPEACNLETLDARADIWAFGVMLYEMLTGARPFTGESPMATLMAILRQPVPDVQRAAASQGRPEVPDALADLVYRMIEKDRAQRIPSVRLVGAELEAILAAVRGQLAAVSYQVLPTTSRFATPAPPAEAKHNLPAQITPFVGRESELESLAQLLDDPDVRLVTILGPGGIGKTRLALEVAAQRVEAQRGGFADGVYLISLAPLRSADNILPTVAEAVNFQFYPGREPLRELLDYLREKQMLLVMDNYEHLLEGAGIVTAILQAAPRVQVLVTSRERLNLSGETAFTIEGMTYPDWETPEDAADQEGRTEYGAVRLFMQSARRAHPSFELQADDLRYVACICRLVQGMPLAILLAAAWVEVISLAEIAAEIMGHMSGLGLDFLETEMRDLPERHRSIRAVFDSSWTRLTEVERGTLARLSVFRGGFTREAAQAVTGVGLRTLMALVNKSLLHRDPVGRYEVHELLRQYAERKLDQTTLAEREEVLDLHCGYYAEFCHRRSAVFHSGEQREALLEISNIRAGWHWAIQRGMVAESLKFSDTLCCVHEVQGWYPEAEALWGQTAVALRVGEVVGARGIALGSVLVRHGFFSEHAGHREKGTQLVQEGLSILRKLDAWPELALGNMVAVLLSIPESDSEAKQLLEESLAIFAKIGDLEGTARTLNTLAELVMRQGAYREAERYGQEALRIGREIDHHWVTGWALVILGGIARVRGEYIKARQFYEEALIPVDKMRYRFLIGNIYSCIGDVAFATGEYEEARRRYQEAFVTHKYIGLHWVPALSGGYWGMVSSLNKLGDVALAMGDYLGAGQYYRQALSIAVDTPDAELRLDVLVRQAVLLAWEGEEARALELVALALSHLASSEATRERAEGLLSELQARLPAAVFAGVLERGRARDLWATAEELLAELEQ
jgi:serine/threonine protein kinase/predicted ATPase/tetratricopeptide (TPR) repeat protein